MSKIFWLGIIVTVIALSPPFPAKAEHGRISDDAALRALYSGATEKGMIRGKEKFEIKYADDGTATVETESGKSDSGKWTIEDGAHCLAWKRIRRGKKACFAVHHKTGDDYHLEALDGANDNDVQIVK